VETWLEGKPVYLIEDGEFSIENFGKESLAQDEFFAELRIRNVTHLGQVNLAILETSGQISIFFKEDKNVKYGLPILPHTFSDKKNQLIKGKNYACSFCGNMQHTSTNHKVLTCKKCKHQEWVEAINELRIT
ncbi:MAG: YetF domain-containing protein, partial [Pelobium sp.]